MQQKAVIQQGEEGKGLDRIAVGQTLSGSTPVDREGRPAVPKSGEGGDASLEQAEARLVFRRQLLPEKDEASGGIRGQGGGRQAEDIEVAPPGPEIPQDGRAVEIEREGIGAKTGRQGSGQAGGQLVHVQSPFPSSEIAAGPRFIT